MRQPIFVIEADVQIDTVQRSKRPDRIGTIFQHARRPGRVRRIEKSIELSIVALPTVERFLTPMT
jgi:hypothetical protein